MALRLTPDNWRQFVDLFSNAWKNDPDLCCICRMCACLSMCVVLLLSCVQLGLGQGELEAMKVVIDKSIPFQV